MRADVTDAKRWQGGETEDRVHLDRVRCHACLAVLEVSEGDSRYPRF
jgi:hypothetical protein